MKTDIIHSAPERLKPAPYQVKSIAVRDARRAVSRCKRANMMALPGTAGGAQEESGDATGADPLSEEESAPTILGLKARLANFLVGAIRAIGATGKTMLAADEREVVDVACVRLCLGVPKVGRQ